MVKKPNIDILIIELYSHSWKLGIQIQWANTEETIPV